MGAVVEHSLSKYLKIVQVCSSVQVNQLVQTEYIRMCFAIAQMLWQQRLLTFSSYQLQRDQFQTNGGFETSRVFSKKEADSVLQTKGQFI